MSGQYGAAKAALIFNTEIWALDLNNHGIRVNTVSPGAVPTAIFPKKLGIAERHHPAAVERLAGRAQALASKN